MILFLTNADTEILALRVVAEMLPEGFPTLRAANPMSLGALPNLEGVTVVCVRLLGGRQAWEEPFDALLDQCAHRGIPLLAFGGEAIPDADLTARSTVPSATVLQAMDYLVQGGVENLAQLLRFVVDTVLMEGFGFAPPLRVPASGIYGNPQVSPERPTIGVVFYRAHLLAGNVQFIEDLCDAIDAAGANALPVFTYSLRSEPGDLEAGILPPGVGILVEHRVDAVVVTTLAAGALDEALDSWDPGALATLNVPILQAICATNPASLWEESAAGLSPLDVAMAVAIPEFDGRIISVPFSFKETVDDEDVLGTSVTAYRTRPDRSARIAQLAVRLARLRHIPPQERRIALVLSAYPTRRSRLGNAVGLDTPASVVKLLEQLAWLGVPVSRIPTSGDDLMAELADTLTYDEGDLSEEQIAGGVGRLEDREYSAWFDTLPSSLRSAVLAQWGPAPGTVYTDGRHEAPALVFSGIDFGGVLVAVQPPRGFGADPIAVYHSPDLPPTHHYLGFYRWLDARWRADVVVHVGKHGTLEWLPGKGVGLSEGCAPDAALGSMPFVYPFVVNDPGEGTQAKRRAHAVVVDHLIPPLTRAETYDDLARLETLLDEHARVVSLDPAKLPAIRRQVWECLVAAEIHRDLGLLGENPSFEDPAFDDLLVEVDGYLCEVKDAQIRGGLHILGEPPTGEAELDLVLAITRLAQGTVPSLRATMAESLGIDLDAGRRDAIDRVEAACRAELRALQATGWDAGAFEGSSRKSENPALGAVLEWICRGLLPALQATTGEIDAVMDAVQGHFVPPGPSGSPSRGQAHVLPTGRNFYSVDPKAIPSRLAWEVGRVLADRLVERHVAEEGRPPRSVALVVWGTAAMRTAGDDVAEVLALLGVRPRWAPESGRVEGLEVLSLEELGRARVDVTVRVSGFFRDAFPHVVTLLDDAVHMVASLGEPPEENPLLEHGVADPRIFGPKPGSYGSGILPLLESRNWHGDADLAAVYLAWGGWSYGRHAMGEPAEEALQRRLATVEVAVKNQDNREHDIFDSDDYLQDHGGMVATIRALTGTQPKAWFGDTSDPARPRVRSLAEEAARVVRSRVLNPKWISAMQSHGYKGAFEMAATVDYLFGYDATAQVVEDWMYEKVTSAYVGDPEIRKFYAASNPEALRSIAEKLLEAADRGLWKASDEALRTLQSALLEAEGWEEDR
jgi:cobaltochelatase CobN